MLLQRGVSPAIPVMCLTPCRVLWAAFPQQSLKLEEDRSWLSHQVPVPGASIPTSDRGLLEVWNFHPLPTDRHCSWGAKC